MAMTFEQTAPSEWRLDVRGYVCPHPQMYTKKALQKLNEGDVLTLIFDNPSSGESILAMCDSDGNELYERAELNGDFVWKIRKG